MNYKCSNGHRFQLFKNPERITEMIKTNFTEKCPYMKQIGTEKSPKGVACDGKVSVVRG